MFHLQYWDFRTKPLKSFKDRCLVFCVFKKDIFSGKRHLHFVVNGNFI